VIEGEVVLAQGSTELTVRHGDVVTWNAGSAYAIENRGRGDALLLLAIDAGLELPKLSAPNAATGLQSEMDNEVMQGPLRLVAMRARRKRPKYR
jgi:hypothetical protein